eukprot:8803384-Pyramimonas_sp.AAC.1
MAQPGSVRPTHSLFFNAVVAMWSMQDHGDHCGHGGIDLDNQPAGVLVEAYQVLASEVRGAPVDVGVGSAGGDPKLTAQIAFLSPRGQDDESLGGPLARDVPGFLGAHEEVVLGYDLVPEQVPLAVPFGPRGPKLSVSVQSRPEK